MHKATTGIIAATLVAALGTTTPAFAQEMIVEENGSNSIEVSFADLNLANDQGQRRMEQRVRSAARRVCGYNMHRTSMQEAIDMRTCVSTATDGAMTVLASKATMDGTVVAVRTDAGFSRR